MGHGLVAPRFLSSLRTLSSALRWLNRSLEGPARAGVKRCEPALMPAPTGPPRTRALVSRIPSVGRDSAALAPSYVVPGLASLLSIPVLFATLGPAQYGILALILAVANGVPQLTTGWLEAVVVRFAHRPEFHMPVRGVVSALLGSCLVGGVLSAVFIPTADVVVAASTALLTGTIGAYLVATARLQAMLRFGAVSGGAVLRAIVGTVGSVAFAAAFGTAVAAAVGFAVGFGLGTAVLVLATSKPAKTDVAFPAEARVKREPQGESRRDIAGYGFGSLAVAGFLYLLSVSDRFVLSSFRPLDEVGVYAATYGIVDLVFRLVPSVLFVVVRPRVFRAWDRGDAPRVLSLVVLAADVLGWILALLSIGVILVATIGDFLPIDARLAGPIAIGLAAFVASTTFALVYGAGLRQGRLAVHLALAAALNVGLNIVVVRSLGPYGAAAATAISYGALLAMNLWALRGIVRISDGSGLRVWAVCFLATVANGVVAGTDLWPAAAVISTLILVALSPHLARLVRTFIVSRATEASEARLVASERLAAASERPME